MALLAINDSEFFFVDAFYLSFRYLETAKGIIIEDY